MPDPQYVARIVQAFTDLMRREQRVELGFSEMGRRFEAAGGGKVTPQVMGRWLKGHEQPREPKRRKAFALVLGVTVGWLFYEEGGGPLAVRAPTTDYEDPRVGAVALTEAQKQRALTAAAKKHAPPAAKTGNGGRRRKR